jgi:hypothetical protein
MGRQGLTSDHNLGAEGRLSGTAGSLLYTPYNRATRFICQQQSEATVHLSLCTCYFQAGDALCTLEEIPQRVP